MSRKPTTRREIRRLDHKKERAAIRQVIGGGHVRQPQYSNWSTPSEPMPIIDDVMPHKAHKTGCPKNHGGLHEPVHNPKRHFHHSAGGTWGWWVGPEFVCQHCNKSYWNPSPSSWLVRVPATIEG